MLDELRQAIDEQIALGREIAEIIVSEQLIEQEVERHFFLLPPGEEFTAVFGFPLKVGNVDKFEIVLRGR